ncbi:MAG: hypothetical protein ACI3Z0_03490, partial [Candidatus Cryptobacteroides sp.]
PGSGTGGSGTDGSGEEPGSGTGGSGTDGSGEEPGGGTGGSGGSDGSGGNEEQKPEPEPVEFTTEINNLKVEGDEYEICITVTLGGDASLVKKALIYIGYTADEMVEAECPVKDGKFSLIYYGLEPGVTYFYKASISNGIETKTSEIFTFTVSPAAA